MARWCAARTPRTMASLIRFASNKASAAAVVPFGGLTCARKAEAAAPDCAASAAAPVKVVRANVRARVSSNPSRRAASSSASIKYIGWAAAAQRSQGIQLVFVQAPDDLADARQDTLCTSAICLPHTGQRGQPRDAKTNRSGKIRHRAHNARITAEPARKRGNPDTRCNADHKLRLQIRRNLARNICQYIRLHRQNERLNGAQPRIWR